LRANYNYYKSKLNKLYNKNDEENENFSKDELISKLNKSNKLEEFEAVMKNIQDDLAESTLLQGTQEQKISKIKQGLKEMAAVLKEQTKYQPMTAFA